MPCYQDGRQPILTFLWPASILPAVFHQSCLDSRRKMSQPLAGVPLLDVSRDNRPLRDELLSAVASVFDSGRFLHGPEVRQLEELIACDCEAKHAIGCASGSDALLLSLMTLGIGDGDE